MTTKTIKRMYRKARRKVCRTIYYWDSCPNEYRKNHVKSFLNIVECAVGGMAVVVALMMIFVVFG